LRLSKKYGVRPIPFGYSPMPHLLYLNPHKTLFDPVVPFDNEILFMAANPIPLNEQERLRALKKYDILDTLPEREFDNLTKLATYVTGSPIALISLLDEQRQWFKSRVGLEASQTPRNISFCQHAIMANELFEVHDACKDRRFRRNPLVTEDPNIRFYAGYPLQTREGYNLGTLCVLDNQPKALTEEQRQMMRYLAEAAISLIEARQTNQELEKVIRYKNEFLSNVSHEIRTPMNAILGFSELLQRTELTKDQASHLRAISSAANNLLVVINDILDLSKNEANSLELLLEPMSPREVITHAIQLISQMAFEKKLDLRYIIDSKIPDRVMGDAPRLNQIVLNLLGNALKFTQKGSISVRLDCMELTDQDIQLKLSVQDTGPGIPRQNLERIFQRFEQGNEDHDRKTLGTGLGLAIVRMLAELHGGTTWAKSTVGEGSTFFCTLRYQLVDPSSQADNTSARLMEEKHSGATLKDVRILLAEDNLLNQKLASFALKKLDVDLVIANHGQEALDTLGQESLDLILMDLEMPVLDGYQTSRIIREEMGLDIPIIACTAHVLAEEKERCEAIGMDGFITKPYKPDVLGEEIGRVLAKKS